MACYTKGIHSVSPDTSIAYIKSGITEPQKYENLTVMQEDFARAYEENPGAEWLLNVSSGTPQIKTVMALLALDYPKAKAIQVHSPEKARTAATIPAGPVKNWWKCWTAMKIMRKGRLTAAKSRRCFY